MGAGEEGDRGGAEGARTVRGRTGAGPDDAAGETFVVQVKSTSINKTTGKASGWFSERYWSAIKALPANANQTPLLVITDAPGPGTRRRALVVLTLDDWSALHVGTEDGG